MSAPRPHRFIRRCLPHILLVCAGIYAHAQEPTVALVLTGGGARGIAQVGAIKQLEKMGVVPNIVVGSSIGAIVGGLYAAGYSGEALDTIFRTMDWEAATSLADDTKRETLFFAQKAEDDRSLLKLRFRDFTFLPPQSLGGSARFASILQNLLWHSPFNSVTDFDQLRFRFRPVATDLARGKWEALTNGNLATAIQASATFPLRYAPVRIDSSILVDGGLVANVPIEAALRMRPDVIIVINTVSNYLPSDKLDNALDVADQALTAAMKQRDSINLLQADVVITPVLDSVSTFDFSMVEQSINSGEASVREAAPHIQAAIQRARIRAANRTDSTVLTQNNDVSTANIILAINPVSSIRLRNTPIIDSLLREMSGRTWSDNFARYWRWSLLKELHNNGWPFSYIRAMAYDSISHELTLVVDPGTVRGLYIDKRRPVNYNDVIREFSFAPGDRITVDDLATSADRLRASELFSDVDLSLVPAADSGVDILVGANDRGNQLLRLGVRIDNERYLQGGVDFIHQNLSNSGVRIGLRGVLSPRIGEGALTFEMPRIMNTLWTASFKSYYSFRHVWIYQNDPTNSRTDITRDRVNEYSEDRAGMRLSAGRQLERNGVILGELRYELQRYRDLDASPKPVYQPLTTIRAVVRWDDRDRIDFATQGRVIDISFESSVLQYSNGISFSKIYAKASSVQKIGAFVVTPSIYIGAADQSLPGAELFSLGGQDLFFGMRQDEERGRQIALGNMDVRYRLPIDILFPTYISMRYDLGAVWEKPELIKFSAFQHGVGTTLGFDTPVGPALLSVGKRFRFLDDPFTVAFANAMAYFAIGVRL